MKPQRLSASISAVDSLPVKSRDALQEEFADLWSRRPRMVRLAINEAAAIVSRTEFPQLWLPELAVEKVEAIARWDEHQTALLRQTTPAITLPAT